MLKWIESTGKNEEAAIEAALSQLGLGRDDVTVELLERAKTGFLGIGSVPAKVKVSYEAPDEPKGAPVYETPAPETPRQTAPETIPLTKHQAARDESVETAITAFITGLLAHMDTKAEIQVGMDDRGNYLAELVGEDLRTLIGRRGETLDAIQQLTGYAVNRSREKRVRIYLDAENYRARREATLIRLANKTAEKAVQTRREIALEPMNAYERHVIHEALQDKPNIKTYSIGVEPNRRTVVAYKAT